jgi:hypothetical protein
MADNRGRAKEATDFDSQAPSEAAGATLGGIAPLEPTIEQNNREQR